MSWQSLHIHYHDPHDRLLVECIAPVVASSTGLIRWFFLRYWTGGPHIRLRLLFESASIDEMLLRIESEIAAYLAKSPSTSVLPADRLADSVRLLAELEPGADDADELFANNSIRRQPYEPELAKYGGKSGVELAEKLFQSSSNVALDVLAILRRTARRRLGIGFGMMLGGLRAAGFSEARMADFLATYCKVWSNYISKETAATWPTKLIEQQRALTLQAANILADRISVDSPAGGALVKWTAAVRDTMEGLDRRERDILPQVTMVGHNGTSRQKREFLLLNYLHTHNNRLGVIPGQEAYMAYLGHHIVCRLAGITPQSPLTHMV